MQLKRLMGILGFVALSGVAVAQLSEATFSNATALTCQKQEGKWTFQSMGNGIVKATYLPTGYTRTQQISDAVTTKPQKVAVVSKGDRQKGFGTIMVADNGSSFAINDGSTALLSGLTALKEGLNNGFSFELMPGEQIFGGGERAIPMNRRGHRLNLYNRPNYAYGMGEENLNYSLPFFMSSRGYGIFFDNPSKGFADIAKGDAKRMSVGFESGELTFYLIPGKNPEEILKRYTSMIGTQPIPARWVFGNFMSRFGYRSEAQIRDIKAKMKADRIPMDAIIIDLFWFGDSIQNYVGNLEWVNRKAWPNPKKMIADFTADSINTVLITEPYIVKGTLNYDESVPYLATDSLGKTYTLQNFYFGKGGIIDMFRNDAKDWFWSKYKRQMDIGVSGWWGDLGEPENHPEDVYHNLKDLGYSNRLYAANEVHNIFGHYWNKMLYTKFEKEYPDVRLFNLNRAGYANSARYIIFPWSGDVGRHWPGFRAQLPIMLTMSISNIPYIHSDAGGFTFAKQDNELYVRWMQMSAFSPILRPHGTALKDYLPNADSYPSEAALFDEPYKSIARKYIQMRYDLLPYNYTLGYDHMANAEPLVKPLFFRSFKDVDALKAEDQYLWGDALLIAPVLDSGATSRKLYLPTGSEWYSYHHSQQPLAGGQWITEKVTLADMPIFVKGGSFIPTAPGLMNTKQYNPAKLVVTYYPSAKPSAYTLFDDDGKTNKSWERKQYELITFKADGKRTITIASNGGRYPGKPISRTITLRVVNVDRVSATVTVNGKKAQPTFDAASRTLSVKVSFNGRPTTVKY
ncbi:TIM-barrel domain-containing protein [Acetobacteroides hydrogenigenes]|uniref:Oligosaccharide 4-alpha-D-glucosyltransferase n=1 Tax=Acetobacteroides hydrogenigenes TaxID=979970 RepID=A0A4V2RQ83_9BACT|nr:TIM-barrel domain-containing protein [Acetobacteroides hydrogenigenes]TCN70570.1 oligosaccharide 4-alpha-D-glucosyltransferase [Acetobacteroides hydrogenigenes]